MPNFSGQISGFAVGDDVEVYRTIANIPDGDTIVKAWLTVKAQLADADASALIQKIITSAMSVDDGVIVDTGASGVASLRFFLLSSDTAQLGNPIRGVSGYPYDIQIKSATGRIYTVEIGAITAVSQVTLSTN